MRNVHRQKHLCMDINFPGILLFPEWASSSQ
uniref:Uncharacterized protein n=1 Tax=Anguilla anguilla TaxID=7936 RepID=A0A0E9VWZ5_ANGAN